VTDDPLSKAELAFLELQRTPRRYAQWAEQVRNNWTAERARGSTVSGAPSTTTRCVRTAGAPFNQPEKKR
jgi:hypothetical protein